MKHIRIGNDLSILWRITRCDAPEDFTGKSLSLFLTNKYGRIPVSDYTVQGNVIEFTFWGLQQKTTGEYGLLLVENSDEKGMSTIDLQRAFALVPSGKLNSEHNIVEQTSDIEVPRNGLSAYELARKQGFDGSEEDFARQLINNLYLENGLGNGAIKQKSAKSATGENAVAFGRNTISSGAASHAEGYCTRAINEAEHAQGTYNKSIQGQTIHSIGIGTSEAARLNAEETHFDGKKYLLGIGGYDGQNSGIDDVLSIQEVLTALDDRIRELETKLNDITVIE